MDHGSGIKMMQRLGHQLELPVSAEPCCCHDETPWSPTLIASLAGHDAVIMQAEGPRRGRADVDHAHSQTTATWWGMAAAQQQRT